MSQVQSKKGRNLIVCNLPQCINGNNLREIFSAVGTVVSTKVMIDVKAGGHRGFGFVLFENADDAARAKDTFDGATVPGDPSKKFHVEFANHDAFNVVTDTAHIFVRNVPPTATNLDVVTYFTQFGEVVSCALRQETARAGQPPTLAAFVEFKEVASAKEAVAKSSGATPFADDNFPLLAKFAETSDIRSERRMRQKQGSAPSNGPNSSANVPFPVPRVPSLAQLPGGVLPAPLPTALPQNQLPQFPQGFPPPQFATATPQLMPAHMQMPQYMAMPPLQPLHVTPPQPTPQVGMRNQTVMPTLNGNVLMYNPNEPGTMLLQSQNGIPFQAPLATQNVPASQPYLTSVQQGWHGQQPQMMMMPADLVSFASPTPPSDKPHRPHDHRLTGDNWAPRQGTTARHTDDSSGTSSSDAPRACWIVQPS